MTEMDFDESMDEMQGSAEGDFLQGMLQHMMQYVMKLGVDAHVGAGRHERTDKRKGHRNGFKPRSLNTRMGKMNLQVPQVRGMEPYSPMFFAKWQRSERALLVACAEMYFMGVSTRKVKNVLKKMGGFELSASTVSCVAAELDEKITQFRNRRLDGVTYPYLIVDATYVRVRQNGRVGKQAVLVVAGINEEGRREMLTWGMADVESEATWTDQFCELKRRGVKGVKWVVSDGHLGIQAALEKQFNKASWQRCWVHFLRNALARVGQKHKAGLAKELNAARKNDDVKICMAEAERIAEQWEAQYPKLAKQIRDQFEETLAVHQLPSKHRKRVYTSNMIERVMREIKRRTNVVGIFPNPESADRLIGAHLLERHEKWCCEQARYLCMEYLDEETESVGNAAPLDEAA